MHARIAAFEATDTSRAEDAVRAVRDRASGDEPPIPGALAMLMLVDRAAGKALGISLFESEEAIAAAEPAFDRLGDEIPEEVRGRRTSVHTYEVAIHEAAENARAARVSTVKATPEAVDELMRFAEDSVLPDARELDGFVGVIGLVNRTAGKGKLITLWESEEALRASETAADELRRRTAAHVSGELGQVSRFEVALMFDRAPRLIHR
jgi:heme-degrading monooxygenase HmoA